MGVHIERFLSAFSMILLAFYLITSAILLLATLSTVYFLVDSEKPSSVCVFYLSKLLVSGSLNFKVILCVAKRTEYTVTVPLL